MAHISEYTIEKIRNRADIIDIISPYVSLKKRGRNHFGVCPFHSEKTASFSVNSEKQIYKCFGCGKGGSSIDFIMEIEKLGFVDAIKFLADQYSIQIEENNSNSNKVSISDKLYEINTIVSDMYNKNLFAKENLVHVEYFLRRGLTTETINEFLLGFSFTKDTILNTFRGKYDSPTMKSSGLFIETKKGYIDRFRDRIMFTLFNNTGKVIGFAGRATKTNDLAKYMNSPETPVYYKSKTLYGIHKTKTNISKENYGVIVEGYMDFLQLYQNGVKNVVAVAGTSLTEDHAHILKRITNNITIAYDGDLAGVTAAIRAGFVLLKNGLEPSVARIPAGSDPDDWVKNEGINPFINSLNNTVSLISFSYEQHKKKENNNPAIFINETLSEIIMINDKVIAELKLTELSSVTGISLDSINDNYSKLINKKNYKPRIENKPPTDKSSLKNVEYDLIKLCFSEDITIRELISRSLDTSWLTDPKIIRIYNKIYLHLNSKYEPDASVIMDQLKNKEDHEQLASILFEMDKIIPTIKMTKDCINRINYLWLIAELENLREKLKEAEDNFQNEDEIIADISKIQSKINSLRGGN